MPFVTRGATLLGLLSEARSAVGPAHARPAQPGSTARAAGSRRSGEGRLEHEDHVPILPGEVHDRGREGRRQDGQDPLQEVQRDDRRAGRRQRGPAIRTRARADDGPASYVTGHAAGGDEEVETRVFGGDPGMGPPGGAADEWTVNVSDTDQRTLTTTQIVYEFQRGTLTTDTYVWKDGMGDWMPITSVPELAPALQGAALARLRCRRLRRSSASAARSRWISP